MKVYVGLGTNLGDRLANLVSAIEKIKNLDEIKINKVSSIYETEPVQCEGTWFYNAVLEIETRLDPFQLIEKLKRIETDLGAQVDKRGKERVIDIDLLFYENQVIQKPQLTVPHPRMHLRRFVLEPLSELNDEIFHPVLKRSVGELIKELGSQEEVKKVIPMHSMVSQEVVV